MHEPLSFSEKEEIVNYVLEKDVKILNLCHIPEDGRLKTLSFSATNRNRVNEIFEFGERVDGSSLFTFIEPGRSDIYVMPKSTRAFMNPFSNTPTLNVMCQYLDENGKPLDIAPQNVLTRAEERLRSSAGVDLKALAELEFYLFSRTQTDVLFQGASDKNYHESAPFSRFENVRNEILVTLDEAGIPTKYAHSEVGRLFGKDGTIMEQHEVEFLPRSLAEMAETVAIAKWIIRNVCARNGVSVSFSPKVALEHAGTGMHIHLCASKKEINVVVNPDGTLSNEALRMIGGILRLASSLSAFGNTMPVSYLRFIARKESPMHLCWSFRNRLALIRIPLWWGFIRKGAEGDSCRETFEYRAPDALANLHLLFAGLTVAINHGLTNAEESLKIAKDLYVEASSREKKRLRALPRSCNESAKNLRKDRRFYEVNDVFPKTLIDKTIEKLRAFKDRDLWTNLLEKPEKVESLLKQYLHYG